MVRNMKENPYYNQAINCTVFNCRYNDENSCTLSKIKVCNWQNKDDKKATMCDSFQKKI